MSKTWFFNFGIIDVWYQVILSFGGLLCVLQDVQQHFWPLPTGCQWYYPLPIWQSKMSFSRQQSMSFSRQTVSLMLEITPRG